MKFRTTAIVAAVLIAAGALQSVQAAVPAAGQSKVTKAPLVDMGVADPAAVQNIAITLPLRNPAALKAFIASTVDPKSPNFRQFLTTDQFTATYGPTADSVATVVAYLQANGVTIDEVADNNMLVSASATNAQLTAMFGTAIHNYSQGADTFQRPVGNAVMPLGLQGVATGVTGLSNQPLHHSNLKTVPRAGTLATEPDFQPQPVSASVITTGIPGQLTAADVLPRYNGLQAARARPRRLRHHAGHHDVRRLFAVGCLRLLEPDRPTSARQPHHRSEGGQRRSEAHRQRRR